ncbi:hypothetical protein CkaCkLH20_10041 [Colletotrichum karsti]|uniref:F-box domain-containing protein n=1 Tax=Colletotrichum karsti TaxID=1095194 RepID=A0A9P6HY34_9PEZI|nr:uncharacterized protein CkaCkLH20_10041 [Colletotrichum karsti]KAF9872544.1 hypothetical protein CkaCkLH20_10041 [Colletotrichum karsti]
MEPIDHPVASDTSIAKPPHALGASTSAKAQLITLPAELILAILELCKKPSRGYCRPSAITALSQVNKQLREACIPIMFETMTLWTKEDRLRSHLQAIDGSRLLKIVRYLRVHTNGPRREPFDEHDIVSQPCEKEAPVLLAKVLGQMTHLQDLSLIIGDGNQSLLIPLRKELKGMVMPSVRKLIFHTTLTVSFIPEVFSELRALSIHVCGTPCKTPGLAAIAPKLKEKLNTLHLYKAGWTKDGIREIADLFPAVENLTVGGEVKNVKISGLVPIFKRFTNLKHLALTDLQVVVPESDIETTRAKWYFMEIEELREDHPLKEDQGVVAKKFFRGCPELVDMVFETMFEWADTCRFRPVKDEESGEVNEVSKEEGHFWPSLSEFV